MGAQVLSIAWRDPPGPGMDAFIEEHGIDYPVYHDLEELVDIPRQVEALARHR